MLAKLKAKPQILYPSIDISKFKSAHKANEKMQYFVSLNRYERKKNIGLALQAYLNFLQKPN